MTLAVFAARGAEIDELDLAGVADHHVLRRQIAVHDAERFAVGVSAFVHVSERFGQGRRNRHRIGPPHANRGMNGARPHFAEASPLDILDHDVRLAPFVGGGLQNLSDAGVLQLGLHPGLVEKSREERFVASRALDGCLDHAGALGALDAGRRRQIDFRPFRRVPIVGAAKVDQTAGECDRPLPGSPIQPLASP